MTREEAIDRLKNTAWLGAHDDVKKTEQAVEMAIEALSERKTGLWSSNNPDAITPPVGMSFTVSTSENACDGCRYNTRTPQEQCLRCKRYWRDSYERKGGDTE